MNDQGATIAKREAAIPAALSQLGRASDETEKLTAMLMQRLVPLLRSEPENPGVGENRKLAERDPSTPLSDTISVQTNRLRQINQGLSRVLQLLEV